MNTILDSSSALQRFKNRNALHVSSPNHASSYILMCKIKKILNKEFTDELWEEYQAERYVDKSKVDRIAKIQQFVIRLEKLAAIHLRGILNEYDTNGIGAMVNLISLPVAKLIRKTSERNEKEPAEMY